MDKDLFLRLGEFIQNLSSPTQMVLVILLVVSYVACRFFSRDVTLRVRLLAFFTVVGFGVVGLITMFMFAQEAASRGAEPQNSAQTTNRSGWVFEITPRVAAQTSGEGWIYCGKLDAQREASKAPSPNLRITSGATNGMPGPGAEIMTMSEVDLYDDQPRYTVFGFKWTLGKVVSKIPNGATLTVKECTLVGDNFWCRISVRVNGQ